MANIDDDFGDLTIIMNKTEGQSDPQLSNRCNAIIDLYKWMTGLHPNNYKKSMLYQSVAMPLRPRQSMIPPLWCSLNICSQGYLEDNMLWQQFNRCFTRGSSLLHVAFTRSSLVTLIFCKD